MPVILVPHATEDVRIPMDLKQGEKKDVYQSFWLGYINSTSKYFWTPPKFLVWEIERGNWANTIGANPASTFPVWVVRDNTAEC